MQSKNNAVLNFWHLLVILSTIFSAIYIPLTLVIDLSRSDFLKSCDWIITIIFIMDLIYNLIDSNQAYTFEQKIVRSNKTKVYWTFIDLISAVPFYIIFGASIWQLCKLLKLARVAQYMHVIREKFLKTGDYLKLIFFVFWILLITHWLACGWLIIRPPAGSDNNLTKYLKSLYWCLETLTTVGYGETVPANNAQLIYAMIIMFLGVGIYGYIIGNIANILSKKDPAKTHYLNNLEGLKGFLKFRSLPGDLQTRIKEYYAYIWKKRLGYNETSFLSTLPSNLKNEVSLILKREILDEIPLFKGLSDDFLKEVSFHLRPEVFTPGEYIFREGDIGNQMYFVIRGKLEVILSDNKEALNTISDGDFFGEIALFTNKPRTASIKSLSYSDLYILDKEIFNSITKKYPDIGEKIKGKAEQRQSKI